MTGRLLVALQFILFALLCWPWSGWTFSSPGLALCAVGAGFGLWTLAFNRIGNFNIRPEPKAGAVLVTGGPYLYVRHPMYAALLLFAAGVALFYAAWPNTACWVGLAAVLYAKSRIEEAALKRVFPAYESYARHTRRLIPFVF